MKKRTYKVTFFRKCCKKATERCEDIKIEGIQETEYPECLVIYCRKCWNKKIK